LGHYLNAGPVPTGGTQRIGHSCPIQRFLAADKQVFSTIGNKYGEPTAQILQLIIPRAPMMGNMNPLMHHFGANG
jgi:hypothetical protein